MNRRQLFFLAVASLLSSVAFGEEIPSKGKRQQSVTLSEICLRLIKDLTADEQGSLQAQYTIKQFSQQYPKELYALLSWVENRGRELCDRSFALLSREQRHSIINELYTEHKSLKAICSLLIRIHYSNDYQWIIFGYQPLPHKTHILPDPEFDHYFKPAILLGGHNYGC